MPRALTNSARPHAVNDTLGPSNESPVPSESHLGNTLPTPGSQITSSAPPASQGRRARSTPVERRSTTRLNKHGRRFWVRSKVDWSRDGNADSPSSYELLVQWLELPDNWLYFHGGKFGGTQTKGSRRASQYLLDKECPTERTPSACQRKVNTISPEPYTCLYSANLYS